MAIDISSNEYHIIRDEMLDIKQCITKYLSFVIGGSGVAVFALSYMSKFGGDDIEPEVFMLVSLVTSVLISFVTSIILYKYHSHNRYAGYCKVISNENNYGNDFNEVKIMPLFLWEESLTQIRRLSIDKEYYSELSNELIEKLDDTDKTKYRDILRLYSGKDPEICKKKIRSGIKQLALALIGRLHTNSWGFPPYGMAVCFVLSFIFFGISIAIFYSSVWPYVDINNLLIAPTFIAIVLSLAIISWILLWANFCGKLSCLMRGNNTIDGFFIRFLAARIKLLKGFGLDFVYLNIMETINDMDKEYQFYNKKQNDPVAGGER